MGLNLVPAGQDGVTVTVTPGDPAVIQWPVTAPTFVKISSDGGPARFSLRGSAGADSSGVVVVPSGQAVTVGTRSEATPVTVRVTADSSVSVTVTGYRDADTGVSAPYPTGPSQGGGSGAVSSVAGKTGDVTLSKSDVGLNNVNNTADANKPVSAATQTAIDAKQTAYDARYFPKPDETGAAVGSVSALRKNSDSSYTLVDAGATPVTMIDPGAILPRVVVTTTTGTDPVDTETYLDAAVTINGPQPFSGATQVRGRGNTTFQGAKKPWRLKLTTASPLLGMPAERDWVLLAGFYDPSAVRTPLAMEMANRRPGLAWTPRFRFVELTMNGVYRGVYMLGEHVEIGRPNKINVFAAAGTTGLPLTGAYTLEIDQRQPTFRTTHDNLPVAMDDPDGVTADHKTYIQNWINTFETALYSTNWLDPATGYARFIDRDSFIDWYLVNELMKNRDSNGFSSIKCYKTRDTDTTPGKLFMGPVWDFDLSLDAPATGFWTIAPVANNIAEHPGVTWIARMFDDPAFWAALVARWTDFRASLITGDTVGAVADRLADRLVLAINRDKLRWGYSVDTAATVDTIKTYLRQRIDWLTTQFVLDTTAPTAPTGLAATPGNAQVALAWTASTDNVAVVKYRVRQGGTVVAEPTGTSYTATGLTNGTQYGFTVSALDRAGNESTQTSISATPTASDATPPSVPTNLTATAGDAKVTLAWTAATDNVGVAFYRVRRAGTVLASPTTPGYVETGLTNGTAYAYTVTAVDAAGNESAQTSAASATPAAFNPTQLSGLAGWLDGADASTVFTDTAGTTPATAADAPIARWSDKSGNGRHATQSASGKRPLLKLAARTSQNVIRFDGTDDLLDFPLSPNAVLSGGFTIFSVAQWVTGSSTDHSWMYGSPYPPNGSPIFGKENNVNQVRQGVSPWYGTIYAPVTGGMDGSWHQYCQQASQSLIRVFADGAALLNTTVSSSAALEPTSMNVGGAASQNQTWPGPIAELIVYNRVLSATERQQVEAYLKAKWALP